MSAATAQVFGIIVVALALTLAATKLVADLFIPCRHSDSRPVRKPIHSKSAGGKPGSGGTGSRTMFFRRSRPQPVSPPSDAGAPPTAPRQPDQG
jgi:hypothetical protein